MSLKKILVVVAMFSGIAIWMGMGEAKKTRPASLLIYGTNLKLAAEHGPIQIYMDETSTNRIPDYAIFEGEQCVFLRKNSVSNMVELWHFEAGFNVMLTKRDGNGRVAERMVSSDDGAMALKYTYVDKDGDGLWDYFLDNVNRVNYFQSNHCWYPKPEI